MQVNPMDCGGRTARLESGFVSRGVRCEGWLFLPQSVTNPPVVIMAHGFAAERSFRLPAFAEAFAGRGLAAYVFDYRYFGDSGGEPRNLVDPVCQREDWDAAIDHVRSLPMADGGKMALWGTSFSGGHVIMAVGRHPDIRAIVAQAPYVGGLSSMPRPALRDLARSGIAAARDMFRLLTGRDPHYVPVVGMPGTFALMNTEESWPGFWSIVPEGSHWENRVPARILWTLPRFNPGRSARRVRCPALIIAAERDSLIPLERVRQVASEMPDSTFVQLPCGHYEAYLGEWFDRVVSIEADFLVRHLLDEAPA